MSGVPGQSKLMTFAQFMEWALYHPKTGYYVQQRNRIGKKGDFATAPTTSSLFGEILADAIVEFSQDQKPSSIIEFGGAQGWLAQDILRQLQWHLPYYVVEKTLPQKAQKNSQLKWVKSFNLIPKRARKNPVIIANEFLDALPFHIVSRSTKGLCEVYVRKKKGGNFNEFIGPLSGMRIIQYFKNMNEQPRVGNRAEVSLATLDWLRKISRFSDHPLLVLIDYGRYAHELYDVARPKGTMRCFDHHQLDENPYEKVGEKDITADVSWTAIEREAERNGFRKVLLWPQGKFLLHYGERLLHERAFTDKERAGLQTLINPEWMGGAFQVMVLRK